MLSMFNNQRADQAAIKVDKTARRLSYVLRSLRIIWTAARGWTSVWVVALVIQGILPAATVYLTKVLVDSVAAAIGAGFTWEVITPVLIPAGLMAAVMLLTQVLGGMLNWIRTAQAELVQDHIKALIHRQAAAVDLEFYETPDYFDHLARANGQADSRSLSILQNLGAVVQNTLTLMSISLLLIPYSIWLPLVLLVSTLPALGIVVKHSRLHHAWWKRTTEKRRWAEYFDQVLTFRFAAAELRIFNLNRFFRESYSAARKELRESRLDLMKRQEIANLGAAAIAFLVTAGTMAWMVWRAVRGLATLGDLALFYSAFHQGQALMRTLLRSMGQLYADSLFLEHLFTFLELEPQVHNAPDPLPAPDKVRRGIEIEDVYFRYPGSEHLALRGLTMSIPAGRTVAVVGPNGGGKSTLLKLLCRFYDPVEGCVKLDGVDIRRFDIDDLWRHISVLFQTYVNYAGTISESIRMSDMYDDVDPERLRAAARTAGAVEVVDALDRGYETILGKQFKNGVDLSEGQFQRLALARTFYRQAPIVLLDEPTSYMDSWAEALWLDRFLRFVEDRTAVVVTHRFTTAMRADLIYVMDEGRVVESGSHADLVERGGLYAASWLSQIQARDDRPSAFEKVPRA